MHMTIPLWTLLAFAAWTLLTLANSVGVSRWSRILTRRARFEDFAEYAVEGPGLHRRGLRAHANCVENLPVFAAIVLVLTAAGARGAVFDWLCLAVIAFRIPHTLVHVLFEQTNPVVVCRSILFNLQWIAMIALVVAITVTAIS